MFESPKTRFELPLNDSGSTETDLLFNALASQVDRPLSESVPVSEGELAVDVLETAEELAIVATMAGTRPEDIELHLHNDFLTIRGFRGPPISGEANYFIQECFWGKFSRTIVLPVDVRSDSARSEYKNGILTIHLPKAKPASNIPIMVVED